MIRSVLICPDSHLCSALERALLEVGGVGILRVMERYPTAVELSRFVRAHAPQLVFLSFESLPLASATREAIDQNFPGLQIVAVHRNSEPQLLLEVMRQGIREFIAPPFDRTALTACIGRIRDLLKTKPVDVDTTDLLYAFVPAKAGVGTSTLAMNTAVAVSRNEGMKTLLADFDLNSGIIRFLLKLTNNYSVMDAADRAADLDENFWPQLVTSIGQLDVLHAGRLTPGSRLEPIQMKHLVDFARRNYKVICADLSGNLEKYSVELMHESKKVFLVTTPELPALYLAREKYLYLQSLDLGDRISIILNRSHKRAAMAPDQVEELVGAKVEEVFPNDYMATTKALTDGRPIDFGTPVGRQCLSLAQLLADRRPQPMESKKKFIEFFSVAAAKY